VQDHFEPLTLEQLDNDLGDLAGYIEGQQILLDFLFDTLAGNLASLDQERLRQALRELLEYPDEATQRPIRRVLKVIGTPKPHLQLLRGGRGDDSPAFD
jgi:hypothetical protein